MLQSASKSVTGPPHCLQGNHSALAHRPGEAGLGVLELLEAQGGRIDLSADLSFDGDYEFNGDGGWAPLMPGPMTERLYQLAATAERTEPDRRR